MSLYVGNTEIKDLYYGNKSVSAYCNGEWIWPNGPQAYNITYTMNSGMYEVAGPTTAYPGQTVYFAATPGPYQTFSGLTVNGQTAAKDYSFVMPNGNATVNVVGKDPASYINYAEVVFQFNSPSNFNPKTTWSKYASMWTQLTSSPNVWKFSQGEYGGDAIYYMFSYGKGDRKGLTDWEILYGNMAIWGGRSYFFAQNTGLKKVHYLIFNDGSTCGAFEGCTNLTEAHIALCYAGNLQYMFNGCTSLKIVSVGDINTDTYASWNDEMDVSDITYAFKDCSSLKYLPILKFNGYLGDASFAFSGCTNVEGGIISAYNRITANNSPVHNGTFYNCGINTSAGSAELAQIPASWK